MDTILIVGIDSCVGANLAATWSDRYRVIGLAKNSKSMRILGCSVEDSSSNSASSIQQCITQHRPTWIVYSGRAAQSIWDGPTLSVSNANETASIETWAAAAASNSCGFTFISSDALFTAPWMFHQEDSNCRCPSKLATSIGAQEQRVQQANPQSLIVRTNAIGWSPDSSGPRWLERITAALESGRDVSLDCVNYATPIHACELANVISLAFSAELTGTYHIGGSERINQERFIHALAKRFELPVPRSKASTRLSERPHGFGRGETSLSTRRISNALEISLPMVSESIEVLYEQSRNGYLDSLNGATLRERVA